jgi:autotransporter-associated beta strand protein
MKRMNKKIGQRHGWASRVHGGASGLMMLAVATVVCAAPGQAAHASTWTGGGGNWSDGDNSDGIGWDSVPNAINAEANFTSTGTGKTIVLDQTATIGTLSYSGSGNAGVSFTLTNPITFDVSSGSASISNTTTGTGSRVSLGSGSIVLNDNLTITNTNTNISGTQAIIASSIVSGTSNVTISNAMNSLAAGDIRLTANNTFVGSVDIQQGAVSIGNNTSLGNAANAVTLGSSGSASLVSTGSTTNLANNITVASGSHLIGSTHNGTTTSSYSGAIALNGDLSVTSVKTGAGTVAFSDILSGTGALTKVGSGAATLSGDNTYTGNTTVDEGTLTLTSAGELRFKIQDVNVSNKVLGDSTVVFDGLFRLDISDLTATSGSWNLVDVDNLLETFDDDFNLAFVGGPTFTPNVDGITYSSGDWLFSEATGNLQLLAVVPEPSGLMVVGTSMLALLSRRRRG